MATEEERRERERERERERKGPQTERAALEQDKHYTAILTLSLSDGETVEKQKGRLQRRQLNNVRQQRAKRVSRSDSDSQSVTIHHATRDPLREREKLKQINLQTKCIGYVRDKVEGRLKQMIG